MRALGIVFMVIIGCALFALCPQIQTAYAASDAGNASSIAGVWRGEMGGLPAVALVISDEREGLSGAVLFYFQERKTANDSWISAPGLPEPMLRMHFEGVTLTFQISHRRAHPPRTQSDPPVNLRLTLTGPNQASLANESERGPALVVTRSEY